MLKDEKKAINRLIDENDFEILKDFPEDSVFKENQFVELENGTYLNIIEKGTRQRFYTDVMFPIRWILLI